MAHPSMSQKLDLNNLLHSRSNQVCEWATSNLQGGVAQTGFRSYGARQHTLCLPMVAQLRDDADRANLAARHRAARQSAVPRVSLLADYNTYHSHSMHVLCYCALWCQTFNISTTLINKCTWHARPKCGSCRRR